jgi:hypothetical protein
LKTKRPEELTPNQLAEQVLSQEAQQNLNMQQPLKPALPKPTRDEFSIHFQRVWGAGWKTGYYSKPDVPCKCPFTSQDERRIWSDGIICGADAREKLEPRPEIKFASVFSCCIVKSEERK